MHHSGRIFNQLSFSCTLRTFLKRENRDLSMGNTSVRLVWHMRGTPLLSYPCCRRLCQYPIFINTATCPGPDINKPAESCEHSASSWLAAGRQCCWHKDKPKRSNRCQQEENGSLLLSKFFPIEVAGITSTGTSFNCLAQLVVSVLSIMGSLSFNIIVTSKMVEWFLGRDFEDASA